MPHLLASYFCQARQKQKPCFLAPNSQWDIKSCLLLAELQICCQTAADVSFLLKRCSQVVEHQLLDAAFTLRVLAQRHHSRLQA